MTTAPILAHRMSRIKPSATMAISAKAERLRAAGKNIINLSIGEPDFDTPDHIKKAAIAAIEAGYTKYTAVEGITPLKQAIVDKLARENHLIYQDNQVIVSCGAKHSLYNLFSALLNDGDEVIIPAPYWTSYPDMVLLTDGKPVIVETHLPQKFKMTPQQLEKVITPKTKLLILNSPSNPTGMAYTSSELAALGEVLLAHSNVMIASDDIYEHQLWHTPPFVSIVNACPALYDRTIVINGISKTYAMTGWRIGYAAGPKLIIDAMKKAQSQSTSSPNSIAQYAAVAALTGDQTCVRDMTVAYRARHDYLIGELQKISGIQCFPSDGTFYTFPAICGLYNHEKGITNDLTLADYLLDKAEIAVVPGSAFGAQHHIRLCYTTSMENLVEAVARLKRLF
ncbi:MAG: aspartate aminotransferase [Gammaproteobacteria bacterium RIFCSPHIGHO2_12_FULL_42_10]|nr:MAG: aspartate aminotransferase [Gammaproteobacteria bacterium RIFCSPHIGHO2_12_FULL_42_10]